MEFLSFWAFHNWEGKSKLEDLFEIFRATNHCWFRKTLLRFWPHKEPLEILRCRPQSSCPGGAPGRCAKGLVGKVCAACPEGKTLTTGKCGECGAVAVGWAFGLLLVLVCIGVSYYITNREVLGVGQVQTQSGHVRPSFGKQRHRYEA